MGFAFDKSLFHHWSVTKGEMRVLKCLGRFKVRADVKDRIFVASLTFNKFDKEDFSVDRVLLLVFPLLIPHFKDPAIKDSRF